MSVEDVIGRGTVSGKRCPGCGSLMLDMGVGTVYRCPECGGTYPNFKRVGGVLVQHPVHKDLR